jgi:hypothetical protein
MRRKTIMSLQTIQFFIEVRIAECNGFASVLNNFGKLNKSMSIIYTDGKTWRGLPTFRIKSYFALRLARREQIFGSPSRGRVGVQVSRDATCEKSGGKLGI